MSCSLNTQHPLRGLPPPVRAGVFLRLRQQRTPAVGMPDDEQATAVKA